MYLYLYVCVYLQDDIVRYCQEHQLQWMKHPVTSNTSLIDDSVFDSDITQGLYDALMTFKMSNKYLKAEGTYISYSP